MPPLQPRQRAINAYIANGGDPVEAEKYIPKKWELHGDLMVVQVSGEPEVKAKVGAAFVDGLGVRIVVEDVGRVGGELRKPQGSVVLARKGEVTEGETVTVHIENRIKYSFDAACVMFSSGNTTERVKMGEVTKPGQVIVDMFAGIGYFTLPMAKNGGLVYALEKNPVSASFLQKNAILNGVEGSVHVQVGDNREVGTELVGTADRVCMGFFDGKDDAEPFIPRALSFLKTCPASRLPLGTIHYHYLSTKEASLATPIAHFSKTIPCLPQPTLFSPQLDSLATAFHAGTLTPHTPTPIARIAAIRKVKSYRPQVFHYVADIGFELW
eukprot:TRINITY_DN1634_c0_g9_i1.p1 TRINITY_DN1634_c0_g9~~TRINITY_DN1634_c0_g9_i1.p1  ORF type:complete len:326 (+),score=58.54 TRINITY_DN1634_c0_g9_i1:211-1188(+)